MGCYSSLGVLILEQFISTGATLLDKVLGGGYALRRLVHIVGDPSTGKTQLAIEACANFNRQYGSKTPIIDKSKKRVYQMMYCDSEAAFDLNYAERLGLPVDDIHFIPPGEYGITLEQWAKELEEWLESLPDDVPGLFILDSLDALPTLKELTTPIEERERGYGTEKVKLLSEIFRTTVQKMSIKNVCMIVISQTRDNITGYGPKKIFSGGNALKFYVSQRLMLKRNKVLEKTIDKQTTSYGVSIHAECDKNKCGPPFRECDFSILFNYGIDDIGGCLEYLKSKDALGLLNDDLVKTGEKDGLRTILDTVLAVTTRLKKLEGKAHREAIKNIQVAANIFWSTVETKLADSLPKNKYAEMEEDP